MPKKLSTTIKEKKKVVKTTKRETTKKEDKVVKSTEILDVSDVKGSPESAAKKKFEYLYAVGRRKTSSAQVRVYKKGEGKITINNKPLETYFSAVESEIVMSPLKLIGQFEKLDVTVKVLGGGTVGQAEAVRHGISRALIQLNPNFRKPLKKAGYITRDARKKERKKPGLKRARRAPQWKKR
jgi:small subunit ribosomal protein S9